MQVESSTPVCKRFVQNGSCEKGYSCSYQHIMGVCYHFFMKSSCKYGANCHLLHSYTFKKSRPENHQRKQKRNTESFVPSDKPADMRMVYTTVKNTVKKDDNHYKKEYHARDVFVVNDLFTDFSYDLLLREINESGVPAEELFKLWHGDSHLIADDHSRVDWKSKCPTFRKVIERIKTYFNMDVKATRFNLYRDGSDWKPLHFDSAAVDPKKAATQNTTIGVSFGRTRDAIFEHATTRTTVALPLENGTVYGFGSIFNREWRHGITQLSAEERARDDSGRISIICWGWVDEKE
jgi:hypothetical protein